MNKFTLKTLLVGLTLVLVSGCNSGDESKPIDSSEQPVSTTIEPPHVHTYATKWSFNNEDHWKDATCGHQVVKDKGQHIFVDTIVPATHTKQGYTHHECSVCGYYYDDSPTDVLKCKIQFVDENNNVLEEQSLNYGELPVYHGGTPTKEKDAQYTYTFKDWNPSISMATSDQIYVATFSTTINTYLVTWKNENGETIYSESYNYGETPTFKRKTPTKPSDAQYSYNFSGWYPEISPVRGDQIYTVEFSSTIRKYWIYWKNYDGKLLESTNYEYGEIPVYGGSTPTRSKSAQYSYTFDGWDSEITEVTSSKTYTAKFKSSINSYTITWKNYDGTELDTETYQYGEMPTYKHENPTKKGDAKYSYIFTSWSPIISKVTQDRTYTAYFSSEINSYKVTWKNYDGSILFEEMCKYGSKPTYKGKTPTRESSDLLYFYRFDGWDKEIETVVGDQEYTATLTYTEAYEISAYDSVSYKIDKCYINNVEEIELPSTYLYGLPIKKICENAFENLKNIKKLVIPNSYTAIEMYAFRGCDSVESITTSVFGTPSTLGNGESIGLIFGGTNKYKFPAALKEVIVTERTFPIPENCFSECSNITSIAIHNGPSKIGDYAFKNCSSLTKLIIPDSVTTFGNGILSGCNSLQSLTIPKIGDLSEDKASLAYLFGASSYSTGTNLVPKTLTEIHISNKCSTIGEGAFYNVTSLTTITIPENVSSIGDFAFYGCSALTSIEFPKNLSSIGKSAFSGCSSLKSVVIPDGITSIQDSVFYNCSNLESVLLPDGVTSIGEKSFWYCSKLKSISLPSTLKTIGKSAFYRCSSFTSVVIPDSVTYIGYGAFQFCDSLYSITLTLDLSSKDLAYIFGGTYYIPSTLREVYVTKCSTLPSNTFDGCYRVTKVELPDQAVSIAKNAFKGLTGIVSLRVPFVGLKQDAEGTEVGENQTLQYNFGTIPSTLTELIIGEECTSIGSQALYGCSSLTSLTIPKSVESIGFEAFSSCKSVESFTLYDTIRHIKSCFPFSSSQRINLIYTSFDNLNTINEGDYLTDYKSNRDVHLLDEDGSEIQVFEIPYGTTMINYGTFSSLKYLKSVTIPETVTEIDKYAFAACTGLSSIIIPNSVTKIGANAFANCKSLTSITLSEELTEIGDYAFYGAQIDSIDLPDGLERIGDSTFRSCSSLSSITIPNSVKYIGPHAFWGTAITLIVIPDTVEYISSAAFPDTIDGRSIDIFIQYSSFENLNNMHGKENLRGNIHLVDSLGNDVKEITIPYGIEEIKDYCFYGCRDIESIVIPDTVNKIGNYSFAGLRSLTSLSIPESVTSIGEAAFSGCKSIQEISIPNQITSITKHMLSGCKSLASITLPDTITQIETFAFSDCSSLSNIVLPDSIKGIADSAFLRCTSLQSVNLPNIRILSEHIFDGCNSLNNVLLPEKLEYIQASAFRDCTSLTSISFPDTLKSISNYAFSGCTALSTITIPNNNGLSIGYEAFSNCTSLTSIIIEENKDTENQHSITFGLRCFAGCTSLVTVVFSNIMTSYSIGDAFVDCISLVSFEMPTDTFITLENYYISFKGCTSLKSIRLTMNAADSSFDNCISLEYILISQAVKEFINVALLNCNALLFYEGTSEEYIANGGITGMDISKLYFYSDIEPTSQGNYWHYVNGAPIAWEN